MNHLMFLLSPSVTARRHGTLQTKGIFLRRLCLSTRQKAPSPGLGSSVTLTAVTITIHDPNVVFYSCRPAEEAPACCGCSAWRSAPVNEPLCCSASTCSLCTYCCSSAWADTSEKPFQITREKVLENRNVLVIILNVIYNNLTKGPKDVLYKRCTLIV